MRAFLEGDSNWRRHQEENLSFVCCDTRLKCLSVIFWLVLDKYSNARGIKLTFACWDGAELSLDRPVWASYVAPRPLGGVGVSAVVVISNTWREKQHMAVNRSLVETLAAPRPRRPENHRIH